MVHQGTVELPEDVVDDGGLSHTVEQPLQELDARACTYVCKYMYNGEGWGGVGGQLNTIHDCTVRKCTCTCVRTCTCTYACMYVNYVHVYA